MTGGLYGVFKTDNELEVAGKWFDFSPNTDKTIPGFKLARMSDTNPRYQSAIEALSKELGRDIELDILTEERAKPHFMKVFLDTILVDWRNVQDAKGNEIPFTKENAAAIFHDLPDLYRVLINEAKKLTNYRNAAVAAVSE